MTTYNHAYSLGFEVPGSSDPDGLDVTDDQMLTALLKRIANIIEHSEIQEAINCPFDTYEE